MSQDEDLEPFPDELPGGRSPPTEELISDTVDIAEDDVEVRTRVYNDRVEIIKRFPDGRLGVEVRPENVDSPD